MLHVNFLQYYFHHHRLEENKNLNKLPFQTCLVFVVRKLFKMSRPKQSKAGEVLYPHKHACASTLI